MTSTVIDLVDMLGRPSNETVREYANVIPALVKRGWVARASGLAGLASEYALIITPRGRERAEQLMRKGAGQLYRERSRKS